MTTLTPNFTLEEASKLLRVILFPLLAFACGVQPPSHTDLERVQARRDYLVAHFDQTGIERCDRITFAALAAASGAGNDISGFEKPEGKWNRDTKRCYPADSKSECSLDGYLSVLLYAATHKDTALVRRMRSFLESSDYICGKGPESVTSIGKLRSIIDLLAGSSLALTSDSLLGFRGHLLANYLWLKRKIYGQNNAFEKGLLWTLYKDAPRSPFLAALAGKTQEAIDNLNDFPTPYSDLWGSAPDNVIYMATVAILEGK